ncbi:MAG TPA: VTT domain-containing protein [Terriglobales bacterium]|jgi:membrane protein DedA with SNARE-associated domain
MHDLVSLIARHGYFVIFLAVFAEAIGLPVPAAVALVAGGAAAGADTLSAPTVMALALIAMMLGDTLLFVLGRYTGWALLGLLCKVSVNPESCILRSAESFYKRGKLTLLIAKFIPGVNTMAPPLAGSMKMRPYQFLRLDLAGSILYASAYFLVGYLFRDFLASILYGFQTAGRAVEATVVVAIIAYTGYRIWLYRKHRVYRVVPRIQVEELSRRLMSEDKESVLLVDVRSHGYYDPGAARLKGSIRLEPNNLAEELKILPKDKEIYLYCT